MTALVLAGLAGLWLAWSNGANDNFKGVATLLGSRTCGPRVALAWGTVATFAGSACAMLLSAKLLAAFSGRGIVPEHLVAEPALVAAVGSSAAAVVMVATLLRMPISTTHALVGGLAGAGVAAAGPAALGWSTLAASFLLPLLVSPVAAAALVAVAGPFVGRVRHLTGVGSAAESDSCVCAGMEPAVSAAAVRASGASQTLVARSARWLSLRRGSVGECALHYDGRGVGVRARAVLDLAHYLSAGAVSFARGVNDTPKIAAILLVAGASGPASAMLAVGAGMAAGGILQAVRVGRTMSDRITPMNARQGFGANLATAALVLGASRFGLPVSTTHVSVGALAGLGISAGALHRRTALTILLAWIATLPLAFVLGAALYAAARGAAS